MSVGYATAPAHGLTVSERPAAEVPGFPPTIAVAMLVALVCGSFAYAQKRGAPSEPELPRATLGPAVAGEAAAGWLSAQIVGGWRFADPAAGVSAAADAAEALL